MKISNLKDHIDEDVELKGWLWGSRGSGKIRFLNFRDGSGFVQVIFSINDVSQEIFDRSKHIGQESSIIVKGKVVANEKSSTGVEILGQDIEVLSASENYPITPKEHGTDFLMDRRHLWLRSPRQFHILKVRHQIIKSIRAYFDEQDFTLVDAPIFTANECEGTSTLFATDYFGENAYLSQSGQLYMESAAAAVGKAYCFGPTFRAENSNTRRHLTEFWMVEPEVAFMELPEDMDLAEGLIHKILTDVLENCEDALIALKRDVEPLKKALQPFKRLHYSDAVKILKDAGEEFEWGEDFGGGHETIIASQFETPVIVHRYPRKIKAFYMKTDPEDETLSLSMDVLAPEGYGEIVGGGQREESIDVLKEALKVHEIDEKDFSWYLDLRAYGSVPHAGFGLGLERTVAWICNLPHVRETIPFPRLPKRLKP